MELSRKRLKINIPETNDDSFTEAVEAGRTSRSFPTSVLRRAALLTSRPGAAAAAGRERGAGRGRLTQVTAPSLRVTCGRLSSGSAGYRALTQASRERCCCSLPAPPSG